MKTTQPTPIPNRVFAPLAPEEAVLVERLREIIAAFPGTIELSIEGVAGHLELLLWRRKTPDVFDCVAAIPLEGKTLGPREPLSDAKGN